MDKLDYAIIKKHYFAFKKFVSWPKPIFQAKLWAISGFPGTSHK